MTLKARIETVLFVTAKAMQIAEIAEILKISGGRFSAYIINSSK